MEIPRDFVGYGGRPPQFKWPGEARLALNIVVNYEEGAERNLLDGDQDLEPLTEAVYPARPGERDKRLQGFGDGSDSSLSARSMPSWAKRSRETYGS